MMERPSLIVKKQVTDLATPVTQDGTSLLVISIPEDYLNEIKAKGPLEDRETTSPLIHKVFVSIKGAEKAGITEAKDNEYNTLVWEHIKDFFSLANGTTLHVSLASQTTTFTDLFTDTNDLSKELSKYLLTQEGNIKLLGVAFNPDYVEGHETSISEDLKSAIPKAHVFANNEFAKHRPIEVILENRKFSGTATSALDLRTLHSGNVMVVSSRDSVRAEQLTKNENTGVKYHAAVGLALGKAASIQVNQNIGRLTVPPLFQTKDDLPVQGIEFSGGQNINDFTEEELNTLHNYAYTYMDKYAGYSGVYFVNDNTCEDSSKSDSKLSYNRVANKAARITRSTFLNYLKATIQVDATTGQLLPSVIERFKDVITEAITNQMLTHPDPTILPEISGFQITIDPTQNVLSNKKIIINQIIVPTGSIDTIETIISLENPK